jgi:pimeloyl-ACP methyl ester carboxylesterase
VFKESNIFKENNIMAEKTYIDGNKSSPTQRSVQTASGRISYTEQGAGPVALFVHGVLLNGHLWRHQLADLSDIRRCIAVDLLAHGDTEIAPDQDVSVTANANMLKEFLDALNIDQVDLVGNDSGGGIAQIFAALYPERVRSLTLTDCDTHDNWPPEAFKPWLWCKYLMEGKRNPIHFSRLMPQAPLPIPVESRFLAGLSPMYQTALF